MGRKTIPKSVRFEVFKRDSFTCQYCGKSAPDVILEVDHIKPVSKGGQNEIINLITTCRDCNRGKGTRELTDDTAVKAQRVQMELLQERREQLDMILRWREELKREEEIEIDAINAYLLEETKWQLSDSGRRKIKKLIKRFGFNMVYTSMEISVTQYYDGTEWGWDNMFNKIGGICYNRQKAREQDA